MKHRAEHSRVAMIKKLFIYKMPKESPNNKKQFKASFEKGRVIKFSALEKLVYIFNCFKSQLDEQGLRKLRLIK